MIAHPDPKTNLRVAPAVPLSYDESILVGAGYDGQQLKFFLKFYNPRTQKMLFWYDNTGHVPYCYTKRSPEDVQKIAAGMYQKLEMAVKFDALYDRNIQLTKIVTRTPTDVGGRSDSIREFIICNEADIRYTDTTLWDRRIEPGMYYRINMLNLEPTIPNEVSLPPELEEKNPVLDGMMRRWYRLMETRVPFYRRIAVDIEVGLSGSKNRMPDPAESEAVIIACSLCSNDGRNEVLLLRRDGGEIPEYAGQEKTFRIRVFESEEDLIAEIFRVLWEYPFILTYNGDEFDFRYLYMRAIRLGFQRDQIPIEFHRNFMGCKNGVHIDLYRMFANMSLRTYAFGAAYKTFPGLDDVSKGLLKEGKLEHEEGIGVMSYVDLARYGYQDAKLTMRLTQYDNELVMKLITVLSRVSYQVFEDLTREGAMGWIRSMTFREHRLRNILIPRQDEILALKNVIDTHSKIEGKKYEGAKVLDPILGIHFNVAVLDFGSLYPSIIKNWNLSYETVRCLHEECRTIDPRVVPFTTHWVCKKRGGMAAELIGSLRDMRVNYYKQKAKKMKGTEMGSYYGAVEQTLKVFMNATYGVFGSDKFALYCPPVSESVTSVGRFSIQQVIDLAKSLGIIVFYGDTDSIFMSVPQELLDKLVLFAKDKLDMSLELDKTYKWLALTGRKKNYVGMEYSGSISLKGVTGKKRHTPQFVKDSFNQLVAILKQLNSPDDMPKVKQAIIELIQAANRRLERGEVPLKDLAFHMMLKYDPATYVKTKPQHVKVALQIEGMKGGDIVSFIKTRGPETARPLHLVTPEEVNIEAYMEFYKNACIQVLDALRIKWDEIAGQTTLDGKPMPVIEKKKRGPAKKKIAKK